MKPLSKKDARKRGKARRTVPSIPATSSAASGTVSKEIDAQLEATTVQSWCSLDICLLRSGLMTIWQRNN